MDLFARVCAALVVIAALMFAAPANAAFPGENGKIAFVGPGGIWTMNADGTGAVQVTTGSDAAPAWSADGTRILFHRHRPACSAPPPLCDDIFVANADGSGVTFVVPAARSPTWSPAGDRLAFMADGPGNAENIYRVNIDGSNETLLYSHEDADIIGIGRPAWAPDGTPIIAFHEGTLETICDPDLEECANLYPEYVYTTSSETPNPADPGGPRSRGAAPNWSPDGTKFAFFTPSYGLFAPPESEGAIGVMNRDGSGRLLLTAGGGSQPRDADPAWSPDGTRIVFGRSGDGIHVMNADGTSDTRIAASGSDPDWQPVQRPHARPKGATPFRVSLVPAAKACASPNRTHGPPLAFPSCSPVQPETPNITVSQGDARLRSIGSVRMDVIVGAPGAPDDSDVQVRFSLTNVMNSSDFSDYTGTLTASTRVRMTDREAGQSSTTQDFDYSYVVPCTATADTFLGSTCASNTSFDAIVPGSAVEGSRAIWALDRLEVYDGQDVLFATQGLFVP